MIRAVLIFCIVSTFSLLKAQHTNKSFILSGNLIELIYSSDNAQIEIDIEKESGNIEIATITLSSDTDFEPKPLSLKWKIPSDNIAGAWRSNSQLDKTISPDWGPSNVKSMLAREAPVICLFGYDDMNRQTFAVSEVLNTVVSSSAVREENGMIYNEVQLLTEKHKRLNYYQFQIRLDVRKTNFSTSLSDVAKWWASFEFLKPVKVPDAAKFPVYSSWYSYHQNVSKDDLVKECILAKSMGFESIIVDDGWQTLDGNRGYAYTGDWEPERITEMKDFVQAVHDLDMKFILWYAVPFAGEKSKAYQKMKGKFLRYWDGQGTYVLDPRFPEVRKFIIDTYIKAVNDWDLDGFKLDFLGRFRAGDDTDLVADDGRDFASVNEATDKLMTDLVETLINIKPDILIEFRQPYTGPAMRKYGNMLRASDCPNVALINRVGTTDLRLTSDNTAVHADMLRWHYSEPVEVAALQLLNVLFSVPQISVRLADIPKDHFNMIRFYSDYWLENRDILLGGSFQPSNPLMNYPKISAHTEEKQITAVYSDVFVEIETDKTNSLDIINAKSSETIVVIGKGKKKKFECVSYDCLGSITNSKKIELGDGESRVINVPASGLVSFTTSK